MGKSQKEKILKELREKFKEGKILIFFGFKGVDAPSLQNLRRQVKKEGGLVKIVKKTLLQKVLDENKISLSVGEIKEEMGIIFGIEEIVKVAKVASDFQKVNENFKIFGGIFEGSLISKEKIQELAQLPPREVLLQRLLSSMSSSLWRLCYLLNSPIQNLIFILNQISTKGQRS
ncbi:50S ribosomal protein L10 [Candidatus Parcubacteria bacterium]|nr:50S ribosomal protein L10 [Candidatus Parcubacteria bacterium]